MRNLKAILFLMTALVALAVAELVLDMNGRRGRGSVRTFLAEGAPDSTSLVLERRGEPPTVLVKGVTWRLSRPFAASVEEPVVLKLLDALAKAPIEESISDAELLKLGRTRADYALEEPPLRVSLSNATAQVSMAFGLLTPSGEGVYVSLRDENAVLIVPSSVLAAVDLPVDRLRRRRLFGFAESAVASFDVKQRAGVILPFAREGAGWRVGASKAATAVVTRFLSELTNAEARGFVWPTGATNESGQASASLLAGYGLDPETAVTVTLKRSGGQSASISFGKPANEKTVYAFVHSGGTVVTVPSALKDAALQDVTAFADLRLFQSTAEKVTTLSLAADGATLTAVRADGAWRLETPISAPADADEVGRLLARALSLTTADLDPNGVAVSLGEDAKPVTVSREALFPDGFGFERLRAKEIVDFSANEIKRLVSRSDATGERGVSVVFARDRRAWNVETAPEGAVVSDVGVARVLTALAPLRALRVEKLKVAVADLARYGLDRPVLRLSIDLDREDAVRRNVLVGARTDGGAFATVGSSDAVFVISDKTVEALSCPLTEGR